MDAACGGGVEGGTDAPLIGFLRRVEAIDPSEQMKDVDEVEWDDYENVSATQCFLKYLEYPECEETPIDLKQAAVIVMSHLDRLSIPHQPALEQNVFYATVSEPQQVHWLGQVSWGASECNHKLGNVEVSALAAYHRGAIGIAKRGGTMFCLSYDSSQPHYLETHLRFALLATSCDGHYALAATDDGGVFQFDFASGGVTMEDATRVPSLDGKDITAVSAGSGHFMALTSGGEVYTWSTETRSATGTLTRNSGGLPGLESNDLLEASLLLDHTVPALAVGIRDRVTDISCGGTACAGNKFYLACTSSGSVYSWGDDNEFGKLGRGASAPFKTPQIVDRLQSVKAVKVSDKVY